MVSSLDSLFRRSQSNLLFRCSTIDHTILNRRSSIVNKMSSTRRSKRKCKSDYASLAMRLQIEVNNTLNDLKMIGQSHTLTNGSNSTKLFHLCLQRMTPHIWYRIIPLDSMKCDDFAFPTGQSWDLLRPLLVHL